MIISIEWLKKFVEIEESPQELAELLCKAGLEAEPTKVPLALPGVIVAKSLLCLKTNDSHFAVLLPAHGELNANKCSTLS